MKQWFFILIFQFSFFSVANSGVQSINLVCDPWPPYQIGSKDSGINGFSTQIVLLVLKKLEVKVGSLEMYPWKRAVRYVKIGKADALFSANYTKEREEFAYYPDEPIVVSAWVMWMKKNKGNSFNALDDLMGRRVGVVSGYSYTEKIWEFLRFYKNYDEAVSDYGCFRMLNMGRVDYVLAETGNGSYIVRELGYKNIVPMLASPIKEDGLYIIFNKKKISREFVDAFSRELKKFKQTPEYEKLHKQFFTLHN